MYFYNIYNRVLNVILNMMNRKLIFIFLIILFLIPNIYSAKLTDFDILIDIRSPQKAYITESWTVSYDSQVIDDKVLFKEKILLANIDLEKTVLIDPKIKPNIYLKDFSDISIGFDEANDKITMSYEISGLLLQNYYETEEDILWKFNENILRNFVTNNLYVISADSKLTIQVYDPLVIKDPIPVGTLEKNVIYWQGISSNEMKILAYEKKPPKPSFVIVTSNESNLFYYLILVFIILIATILIFKKPLENSIQKFVINNSEIKPKKQKKEFVVDSDFFDD